MRLKTKVLVFFIGAFILAQGIFSQNGKDEIIKLNKKFSEIKNYSLDIDFETYIDGDFKKPYKTYTTSIKRNGVDFYYKRQNVEMMQNNKYIISLDHVNKMMIIQKKEKIHYKRKEEKFINYIDSIMKVYSSVKIETVNELRKMTFEFKTGAYNKCMVVYNPVTYMIESFTIDYKNKFDFKKNGMHSVVNIIRYKNFTEKPQADKDFFSEKNYFAKIKTKIKAASKFQTYQIVSKI